MQIFTSKEFEVDNSFSRTHFATLKKMGEGIGVNVSTNKFVEYNKLFEDKQFIVASNKLPDCSFKYNKDYS